MLHRIKNSFLSKCLLLILTGYFSISSINISSSFTQLLTSPKESSSLQGIAGTILKKIFKCEGIIEELEDFKAKESKNTKLAKGIPFFDYLIPSEGFGLGERFHIECVSKNYVANLIHSYSFHGKIYVPPPQNLI